MHLPPLGSRTVAAAAALLSLLTMAPFAAGAPLGTAFIVKHFEGNNVLLQNDRGSMYLVSTFSCPLVKNDTVYINATYAGRPRLEAEIVKYDTRKEERCPIIEVREITDRSSLLRTRENENTAMLRYRSVDYDVEYGIGCSTTIWSYVGKSVFVRLEGKLDGIGDALVLPNGDGCEVWSANPIGRSAENSGVLPCPDHAHENPKDPSTCVCDGGFDVDAQGTACVATRKCPPGSTGTWGSCRCSAGSAWSHDACVTYTQACKDRYGQMALGDTYGCYCSAESIMNIKKTACVKTTSTAAKKCAAGKEWQNGICKAKRKR